MLKLRIISLHTKASGHALPLFLCSYLLESLASSQKQSSSKYVQWIDHSFKIFLRTLTLLTSLYFLHQKSTPPLALVTAFLPHARCTRIPRIYAPTRKDITDYINIHAHRNPTPISYPLSTMPTPKTRRRHS